MVVGDGGSDGDRLVGTSLAAAASAIVVEGLALDGGSTGTTQDDRSDAIVAAANSFAAVPVRRTRGA